MTVDKKDFQLVVSGEKKEENVVLKQMAQNRYTYIDEADGKRYLRRFDLLRLCAGNSADRGSVVVQVSDTTYAEGTSVHENPLTFA